MGAAGVPGRDDGGTVVAQRRVRAGSLAPLADGRAGGLLVLRKKRALGVDADMRVAFLRGRRGHGMQFGVREVFRSRRVHRRGKRVLGDASVRHSGLGQRNLFCFAQGPGRAGECVVRRELRFGGRGRKRGGRRRGGHRGGARFRMGDGAAASLSLGRWFH